jgi:hyperosmotically inducible protein
MTLRRTIGTLVLGAALALPSASLAHGASAAQKSSAKTKGTAQKTAGKAAKSGQKGGDKGKAGGIESGDAVTDSWISMKIKTDFGNENTLKGSDINVETKGKVVTLKGTVASEAGKTRAEQIAKQTQGVTKVIDNLTIKR